VGRACSIPAYSKCGNLVQMALEAKEEGKQYEDTQWPASCGGSSEFADGSLIAYSEITS
jgi:hypothetical protein